MMLRKLEEIKPKTRGKSLDTISNSDLFQVLFENIPKLNNNKKLILETTTHMGHCSFPGEGYENKFKIINEYMTKNNRTAMINILSYCTNQADLAQSSIIEFPPENFSSSIKKNRKLIMDTFEDILNILKEEKKKEEKSRLETLNATKINLAGLIKVQPKQIKSILFQRTDVKFYRGVKGILFKTPELWIVFIQTTCFTYDSKIIFTNFDLLSILIKFKQPFRK